MVNITNKAKTVRKQGEIITLAKNGFRITIVPPCHFAAFPAEP